MDPDLFSGKVRGLTLIYLRLSLSVSITPVIFPKYIAEEYKAFPKVRRRRGSFSE